MKRCLYLLLTAALLLGLGAFALPARAEAAGPDYGSWREAYAAVLTDEKVREAAVGDAADYRKFYFSSNPELMTLSAYALADVNGDGTPELLLYAEGTGLTDLFTYDGGLRYLGYDAVFGFLPERASVVVHGHWHGAGGSGEREWSIRPLFGGEDRTIYLDCLGDPEGKCSYSFGEFGHYESAAQKAGEQNSAAAERYADLYERYVRPCVRLADIPLFAPDNLAGFVSPCVLKHMRRLSNAIGTFPYAAEEFLQEKRWEGLGLDIGDETPLLAARLDLDLDGVPELLLTNGRKSPEEAGSWIFRYNAMDDRMVCVGEGPGEALVRGHALYGREADGSLCAYELTLLRIRTRALGESEASYLEKYEKPEALAWSTPEQLAQTIAKGE